MLFLGDNGHHQPRARFEQLQPVMAKRGIRLVYTDQMADINADNLSSYDALLVYANIDRIEPQQEKALLDYVAGGGGFVPLHCATYCFRNSAAVVALMGGQFKRHGTGVFRTTIENPGHPITQGYGGFESWDETYVHHLHNEKNRTVLAYRVDAEGREPWTWVRTHGDGRVFYTAWGHDERTWGNAGFQNLVERGIRWAAGDDVAQVPDYLADMPFPVPKMTEIAKDLKPFEYMDVGGRIPNYTASDKWGVQGEDFTKMQKPIPADESIKHISVPQGFRVELFASEPEIGGKPIAMAWDERGRLWVAETYDYPNELQPEGKGRDRIRILEDTDGDWKADKFTVFAEKLSIPTSHHLSSRRRDRARRDSHFVSERHRWRRCCRRTLRAVHRLEPGRYSRRCEQFPIRTRQLDLGDAGLQQFDAHALTVKSSKRFGRDSFASSPMAAKSNSFARPTTTRGGSGSAKKASSLVQPPTVIPVSTCRSQSVLRTGPRLGTVAGAGHDR